MTKEVGFLEICMGPMFSGKTTQLIKSFHELTNLHNKKCIILDHSLDVRYDKYKITSHDKKVFLDCIKTDSIQEFICCYKREIDENVAILIDECQFFNDIENVLEIVAMGKHVIIYGLDGDSNQNIFGNVFKLIPHCDKIKKLKGRCMKCGMEGASIYSIKLSDENHEQICIGGSDKYISVCRKCYNT
jgi:thymidine kinase